MRQESKGDGGLALPCLPECAHDASGSWVTLVNRKSIWRDVGNVAYQD